MNYLLLACIVWFWAPPSTYAQDSERQSLTKEEATAVEQSLRAYQNGDSSLDDSVRLKAFCPQLLAYYAIYSNSVSLKAKLPISRCLGGSKQFDRAKALALEYVGVYSNDWHGWKVLGGARFATADYPGCVTAYTNAIKFGDTDSGDMVVLSNAALLAHRYDVFEWLKPTLLVIKTARDIDSDTKFGAVRTLIAYSIRLERADLFLEALKGIPVAELRRHDELLDYWTVAAEKMKSEDVQRICRELNSNASSGTRPGGSAP